MRAGRPLSDRQRLALKTRNLNDRRTALTKERLAATRELQQRRQELEGMSALGRVRRGRGLRERIDYREREVVFLDRELERLDEQQRLNHKRALELARAQPRPERGLTREPALEPGLEREHDLGMEL